MLGMLARMVYTSSDYPMLGAVSHSTEVEPHNETLFQLYKL